VDTGDNGARVDGAGFGEHLDRTALVAGVVVGIGVSILESTLNFTYNCSFTKVTELEKKFIIGDEEITMSIDC
jgi:hypothetical protein